MTLLQECGRSFRFEKLLQYQIHEPHSGVERLLLLRRSGAIYFKNPGSESDAHPTTINFAKYQGRYPSENVNLVLQSKAFNISQAEGMHMYVVCSVNILTHYFILHFLNLRTASNFFVNSSVEDSLNPDIDCPTDWLTSDVLQQVYAIQ